MTEDVKIVNKAYKFRIYPNQEQASKIDRNIGSARFVYNHFLDIKIETYKETKESLTYNTLAKELPKLKKLDDYKWLKEADSTSLQQSLKDLDKSYQNFFRGLKKKSNIGFPKFKSKHKAKLSYRITMSTAIIDDSHISIPKVGVLKARHGFITPKVNKLNDITKIVNATISKSRSGKYFISLACEVAVKPKQSTSKRVGIDLGVKYLVTLSEEINPIPNPKHLQKYLSKLAKEQRILARRVKGSNNRAKQKLKVSRLHDKITNSRRNYLNQVSSYLVNTYDVIVMEDLDVKSMLENEENKDPKYNMTRRISDASFAELKRQLEYKCDWYGKQLLKISRYYPSSKTCSNCGEIKDQLERSESVYECEACGLVIDRDKNASINILTVGTTGLA